MTIWQPSIDEAGPVYLAITRALEADVRSGRLRPGDRLPTHRALASRLGVNVGTVSRAYAEARRQGLIRGHVGRGTFIAGSRRATLRPVEGGTERGARGFARGAVEGIAESVAEGSTEAPVASGAARGVIDLGVNLPLRVPGPDLAAGLRALADAGDLDRRLSYGDPAGAARTRRAGATWLRRCGLDVTPEQVVVCAGAQHAILVALGSVVAPGDEVLCESLTYPGFLGAARLLGLRVRPIAIDADGLVPEALEAACAVQRPRLLYCMPSVHNPTSARMPAGRREAVARIAQQYDLTLVQDDVQLGMLDDDAPSLATLAPDQTLTIASLSKVLLPALRIAFLTGARRRVDRLAEQVWSSVWMSSPIGAELATRWIEDGSAEPVIAARLAEMQARHAIAREVLADLDPQTRPGAYHAWLRLPAGWEGDAFQAALRRRGVAVTPASAFQAASGPAPAAVRLSLSAPPDRETLRTALERIRQLASEPGHASPVRL